MNDMESRHGIMQSVEPVLENAIKILQKVVDVRGMGKSLSNQDMVCLHNSQDMDSQCLNQVKGQNFVLRGPRAIRATDSERGDRVRYRLLSGALDLQNDRILKLKNLRLSA